MTGRIVDSTEYLLAEEALARLPDFAFEGKYIRIILAASPPRRKTKVWRVLNKYEGSLLGSIEWFTIFRKYSFLPLADRAFEEVCLREISNFLEAKTKEHRDGREAIKRD